MNFDGIEKFLGELIEQAARNASNYYETPPPKKGKKGRIVIGGLIVAHLTLLYYLAGFQDIITPDGYYYCAWAVDSVFPVGYPAMIRFFRLLISDSQTAGTIVSILAMCGSTVLVYLLARRFMSQGWSIGCAIVFALTPISLRVGVLVLSEAQYVFFTLLAFYFFERKNLLCGIFAGLAFVTRPEAVVFFMAILTFYVVKHRQLPVSMVGAFIAIALLASTSLWLYGSDFALTRKTAHVYGLSTIIQNYPANLVSESELVLKWYGIPLVLLFLLSAWKNPSYLLLGCVQFLGYPLFSGLSGTWRFVFPFLPFVVISTFIFLSKVRKGVALTLIGLILIGFLGTYEYAILPEEPFVELKYAGIALKPHVNEQTVLMGKKSYTAFYAGLATKQFLDIPNVGIDELHRYAKAQGVTHLVVSRRVMQIFRPQLMGLFDAKQCEGRFGTIWTMYPRTDYEVVLLRPL